MKKLSLLLSLLFICFTAQATPTINILFVYTPAAGAALGGGSGVGTYVGIQIANMNQAFRNSAIDAAVVSAAVFSTSTEYPMTTLEQAAASVVAAEANVAIGIERDAAGAAVVVVLGPPAGFGTVLCGYADGFLPGPFKAYAMVAADCFVTTTSLQHEVGHLMGLHHQYASDPDSTPGYPNSHGYRFEFFDGTSADYCANTLMVSFIANTPSCDMEGPNKRINYYGNPAVSISNGKASAPTGNTASPYYADEAHTLISTIPIVANYRTQPISKAGAILNALTIPLLLAPW